MSAIHFAKAAYSSFARDKPHSSITEWVEILTSRGYDEEAYDGIPELVDSISIQATGPTEASRAIRKKLKHGDTHQQYRAIVILGALVGNGGQKFKSQFADGQLIDAIKALATESTTDPKVKKRLLSVLAGWSTQFKDDPSMHAVANLYNQVKPSFRPAPKPPVRDAALHEIGLDSLGLGDAERRKREERERKEKKEEDKRKLREAKEAERRKAEEERRKKAQGKTKRKPFNFDEEKPQILTAIASASQASSNLVNAITLVNTEHDSLQTNARVQECLAIAKVARKQIVRYVQLVENEDMIGTLIETNDRIIAALESYDTLSKPAVTEKDVDDVQNNLAAVKIQDSELGKLQEKQRAAVQRSLGRSGGKERALPRDDSEYDYPGGSSHLHPDLQDLSFGPLGTDQRNLPPPMRPSALDSGSDEDRRGSLSDYSDYESSDGEAHNRASSSAVPRSRGYVDVSDDEADARRDPKRSLLDEEDPFADPFADQSDGEGSGTPGINERKGMKW